jgi:C4-dicarboxylate transporter/malic acid transport protein
MKTIKNFTPTWFTVGMGTGIVAIDAYLLPGSPVWLKQAATVIWLVNLVLVAVFSGLFVGRALVDRPGFVSLLHHPFQSMFFGAIPMALTTIVNGFLDMGPAVFGHIAIVVGAILWDINAVLALASVVVVPFFMFTTHDHHLNTLTAVWLMPIVPAEVAAASGGLLIPHLTNLLWARDLFVGSITLWALSVPLAFLLLGMLFLRLAIHKLPPADMAFSTWITLGTIGTGVMGLILLGRDAMPLFSSVGPGIHAATVFMALVLWGFGLWWLIQSLILSAHYLRHHAVPFNLGWWGLTFPLGVFAAGTDLLNRALAVNIFGGAAIVFFLMLASFWLLVSLRTLRYLWGTRSRVAPSAAPVPSQAPRLS